MARTTPASLTMVHGMDRAAEEARPVPPKLHQRSFSMNIQRTQSAPDMPCIVEAVAMDSPITSPSRSNSRVESMIRRCRSVGEPDLQSGRQEPIAKSMARRHSLAPDRSQEGGKATVANSMGRRSSLQNPPALAQRREKTLTTTPRSSAGSSPAVTPRNNFSSASSRATRQLVAFCEEERARSQKAKASSSASASTSSGDAQGKLTKRPRQLREQPCAESLQKVSSKWDVVRGMVVKHENSNCTGVTTSACHPSELKRIIKKSEVASGSDEDILDSPAQFRGHNPSVSVFSTFSQSVRVLVTLGLLFTTLSIVFYLMLGLTGVTAISTLQVV